MDITWLGATGTKYTIGGRATDITQIAYSLEHRIKEIYPMNGVPIVIVDKLKELQQSSEETQLKLNRFLELVELNLEISKE
jgi:hypothetical protein